MKPRIILGMDDRIGIDERVIILKRTLARFLLIERIPYTYFNRISVTDTIGAKKVSSFLTSGDHCHWQQ